MAEREQTFNLNAFSYEGAGKVYETLARNATAKAQGAKQATAQYGSEHRQASGQAASFRQGANASLAQANAALTRGNQALTRGKQQAAKYEEEASIKLANSLAKVGEHYLSAQVTSKALEGTTMGMQRKADLVNQLDTDPDIVANEIEQNMLALEDNPDDPFLKNYLKQISPVYAKAREVMEDNRVETVSTGFLAHLAETDGVMAFEDKKAYAGNNGVDVAMLNNIHYGVVSQKYNKQLEEAPNSLQAVDSIMKERESFMDEQFNNIHFKKSKSADTSALIKKADKEFQDSVKLKLGQIREMNTSLYLDATHNPLKYDPDQVAQAIQGMQVKQMTADTYREKFAKEYTLQTNYVGFLGNNPDSRHKMIGEIPPEKKGEYEQRIATELMTYIDQNDLSSVTGILANRSNYTSEFKELFNHRFNSASMEEKGAIARKLTIFADKPEGVEKLGQLLGVKELNEFLTKSALAQVYEGDFEQASKIYSSANTMSPPAHNEEYDARRSEISKYSTELAQLKSKHIAEFEAAAKKIALAEPGFAEELIEKAFNRFATFSSIEGDGYLIKTNKIAVDRTYASESYLTAVNDIDKEDIRDSLREIADEKGGMSSSRMTFLPGGKVEFEDVSLGRRVIMDYNRVVDNKIRSNMVTTSLSNQYKKAMPTPSGMGRQRQNKTSKSAIKNAQKTFVEKMRAQKINGERAYKDYEIYDFMMDKVGDNPYDSAVQSVR